MAEGFWGLGDHGFGGKLIQFYLALISIGCVSTSSYVGNVKN